MEINWKEIGWVALAGALGGSLSLVYSFTRGVPPSVSPQFLALPAYLFLGAGAGLLGVYVLAKTDTRQTMHCLGFSLACGLSWAPVFDASTALVEKSQQEAAKNSVQKQIQDTVDAVAALKTADEQAAPAAAAAVVQHVNKLAEVASRVNDLSVARTVDGSISDTLLALQQHASLHPVQTEVVNNAIRSVARVKAMTAIGSLRELGAAPNIAPPAVLPPSSPTVPQLSH